LKDKNYKNKIIVLHF